jgi:hypothetical protein
MTKARVRYQLHLFEIIGRSCKLQATGCKKRHPVEGADRLSLEAKGKEKENRLVPPAMSKIKL